MYRALVCDDEENIREGLSMQIEAYDLHISVVGKAKDGKQAMELFDQLHPDIVLMDINMPLFNGLECTQHIREVAIDTKVIIVSSYDNFKYAQAAIQLQVDSYLLKPIDENELYDILKKCLNKIDQQLTMNEEKTPSSQNIIDFIHHHYADKDLSSEMIEKEFGLSRTALFNLMKTITDKSLNEYITTIRIRAAIALMKQQYAINEIAAMTGYSDAFYFSRVFKKQTGFSPRDYKKLLSEGKS